MSMMGPYILIAAGHPDDGSDLLLVDWQKGHVTKVGKKTE